MTDFEKEVRAKYVEVFGKPASGNAKLETMVEKLKKENVTFTGAPEAPEAPQEQPQEMKIETLSLDSKTSRGQGASREYLVFFRGQERWWTAASIQAMRSFAKDIKFSEGTDYDGAATFFKCKTC